MLKDFELILAVSPLLDWFSENARVLPWRSDPTPYRVWISEIMLQQTRVEAVKPYYERFLAALPTIQSLAACPPDQLLKLWEGLGYYNRARNLQAAARQIMEDYGGEMPSDYETLQTLKGIGRYTAGAIASIAFGVKAPAVDGNVLRVLTRLTADDTDVTRQSFRTEAEEALMEIIPEEACGDFNQALMELGATVCLPGGEPRCEVCPWMDLCEAHRLRRELDYPVKTKQKPRRVEEKTVFVVRLGDRVLLQKRPDKGLLAGLYEFPGVMGLLEREEAAAALAGWGLEPLTVTPLGAAKHIFSHVEWHMTGYLAEAAGKTIPRGMIAATREELQQDYPIPAAYAAYSGRVF